MSTNRATIRELRTDFQSVKRKIEEHGEIVITDRGKPAYVIKPLPPIPKQKKDSLPDYCARLRKRQPTALSVDGTRKFWDEERQ